MDPADVSQVLSIAAEAEAADGVAPLDEAAVLALRHRPESVRAVLADDTGDDAGFAVAIGSDLAVVVRPEERGRGLGTRLAESLLADSVAGETAWMHGDSSAARALAARFGFEAARELWVMRLIPQPDPTDWSHSPGPDGMTLRGFRAGDESEIVRVNAAAFSWHPEQGAMDLDDLRERMASDWFEPEGLIEAWDGETLRGFHWTKRHPDSPDGRTHGEIYVVAVDPAAQGRGLGRILTIAGLEHMHELDEVHLYVESDNLAAVRLYQSLGFTHSPTDTHVQFTRDLDAPAGPGSP